MAKIPILVFFNSLHSSHSLCQDPFPYSLFHLSPFSRSSISHLCYVFIGHRTNLSFSPVFPYRDPYPLSYTDYIGLPRSFFLSTITPIFDRPLCYLVALCLSLYQWLFSYHVRCIGSQSGGTVGFGLCPLCLVALFARVL